MSSFLINKTDLICIVNMIKEDLNKPIIMHDSDFYDL